MKRQLTFALLAAVLSLPAHAGFLDDILPKHEKFDPNAPQPNVDLRSALESNKFFLEQAHLILATPKGNAEAHKQMLLMAQNGYSDALVFLGYLNDNGLGGLPVNYNYAAQYFKEAAARGNLLGFHNLGAMFLLGRGMAAQPGVGLKLLDKPLKKGVKHTALLIALFQESQKKYGDSARLFMGVADDKRHPLATSKHAHYLLRGIGGQQSLKGAFTMMNKAAELWDPDAQWGLVEMYSNGIGTVQNSIEAMKWAYVLQKNPNAIKYHPKVASRSVSISTEDQEIARQSAELWVSTHQNVPAPIDYAKSIWLGDLRDF